MIAPPNRLPALTVEPEHCAMCRPFDARPDLSHGICSDCERVMDRAIELDANDEQLALLAVRAYGAATYDAAVLPSTEAYDRKDRAYRRVERLVGRAIENAEPSHPRPSTERRTLDQGEEGAGASSDDTGPPPREGPRRPSAHHERKTAARTSIRTTAGDDAARMRHAVTTTEV